MEKLIVILGQTSSGKTSLSIKLAKKFNGEIVSADSRQVYQGMDIGSGKVTKKEMSGIKHYLLDVANPKRKFSVAQYKKLALKEIKKIQKNNKLPFLVGGTGFYIQSIVDGIIIPEVKPDWKLREKLEKLTNEQLFENLKKLDPNKAETIDKNNSRRLVRALEIIIKTKKPIAGLIRKNQFDVLQIGIIKSKEELKKLINRRLLKRLPARNAYGIAVAGGEKNMLDEVRKLHKTLSWKRLEELGLEYRFVAQYLQDKITYKEMADNIQKGSEQYAKRQMTWFKRDKRIYWVKNYKQAEKLIKKFI